MKRYAVMTALALAGLTSGADASEFSAGKQRLFHQASRDRPIARLANQELGYSVLHPAGSSLRGYRVDLVCTLDDSFMRTYCPTTNYYAACPRARITCQ